jgi:hypothetical protein
VKRSDKSGRETGGEAGGWRIHAARTENNQ